jgi:hypothetical protein
MNPEKPQITFMKLNAIEKWVNPEADRETWLIYTTMSAPVLSPPHSSGHQPARPREDVLSVSPTNC